MTNKQADYTKLNAELEQLVNQLQIGELGIDAATKAYERGMELVTQLEAHLKTAENQITELRAKLRD